MNNLEYFARSLLSEEDLALLIDYNVPATGINGLRRYLAEQSFAAFIKLYFADEFYLPMAPFQLDMIADCQEIINRLRNRERGLKLARVYPRAHGKSSIYARLLPLYCLLYNISPLTVLIGNTYEAGKRLLKNIKNICESNDAIIEDFGDIRGEQWGLERLESKQGAAIQSFGIETGSIRGISNPQRPRLVILDDIDDDASVRSNTILAAMKDVFDKSILQIGDAVEFTTHFIVTGTLIRKTSLLRYILDSPEFDGRVESAVKSFADNTALWDEWRAAFLQLARENRQPRDASEDLFYQEHKEELLAGTQLLWEREDAYRAAMITRLSNERAFYSELQNQPQDSGVSLGVIQRVALPANMNEWHLIAALDPSIKGNSTNDLSAWIELLFNPRSRQMIVSYVDAQQRSYAQTISDVVVRINASPKRYNDIIVEANNSGEIIANEIQARIGMYRINRVHNYLPKHERISVLSQYLSLGQLLFYEDLDQELFTELESYPFSRFDDALDSLATAVLSLHNRGFLTLIREPSMDEQVHEALYGIGSRLDLHTKG